MEEVVYWEGKELACRLYHFDSYGDNPLIPLISIQTLDRCTFNLLTYFSLSWYIITNLTV